MKKVKTALWLIVTCLIILFIVQNLEMLTLKQTLKINTYVVGSYQTPEAPIAILFISCFLIGYLLAYFFSLSNRFKLNKLIKQLSDTIKALRQKIAAIESEPNPENNLAPAGDEEPGERSE